MSRPVGGGQRRTTIILNGVTYRVARDPQTGAPLWRRERGPALATELLPFQETVSFGYLGLGGSDPSLRGTYDYALDVDVEEWDRLRPGPLRRRLGLSLPKNPAAIVAVRATENVSTAYTTPTGSDEGTSWTNPGNITAADSLYATATGSPTAPTSWLRATNWGISGLTSLLGILVEVKGKVSADTCTLTLQLLNGTGTPVGNTRTVTLTTTETYLSAGGPSDLWEAALIPSDLSSTSFGVRMRAEPIRTSRYATTVVQPGSWTNPNYALGSPDGLVASYIMPAQGTSGTLVLGYDFPAQSTSGTVTVTVRAQNVSGAGDMRLWCILREGVTDKASGSQILPLSLSNLEFTFNNISITNAANIRVALYVQNLSITTGQVAYIDCAQVTLPLGSPTISIDHVRLTVTSGTQSRKMYVGGGNKLAKVDLGFLSVDNTTTFTHGEPGFTPEITDIAVVKDGADPFNIAPTGLSGPILAICFGQSAQIQQINSVTITGADTYQTLATTKAFASAMATTISPDNTQVLVWRATRAASGTSAFSKIQQAAVSTSLIDLTADGTWQPAGGYQVADIAESITDLTEYARGLVVGKPSGLYTVDDRFSPFMLFGTRAYRHEDNCRNLLAWGTKLLIPTTQDLAAIPGGADPFIGLSRLVANRSPVQGYPTALACFGRYVFCAFYDGVNSWICKGRLSQGEVPWPVLWHSLVQVANAKVRAIHVTDDGKSGPVRLFYSVPNTDGTYDVEYFTLAPRGTTRQYQSGGVLYTQRFGVLTKRSVVRRIHAFGRNCTTQSYWTIEISFDDGPWQLVGRVQQNGYVAFDLPQGVSGYVGQLRFTATLASPNDSPELIGTASEQQGPGGVVIEGYRQADEVERFQIQVRVGEHSGLAGGGRQTREPAKVLTDLAALLGKPTTLVAEDLFGDRTARTVVLQTAQEVPTAQEGELPAERSVLLQGYVLG